MFDRRQLVAGAAVLVVATGYLLVTPGDALDRVATLVHSPWFPVVLIGLYLLRPLVAWPITVLSALVGYRYGVGLGVPLALGGAVATSLIPYAVGRRLRTDHGWGGRVTAGGEAYFRTAGDLRGVVAARLAPTPAEAISAGAGIADVPLAAFVIGTLLGELPWTVAAVAVGASIESSRALGTVALDPRFIAGGVLAALLLVAGPLYRRVATGA
ncbi:MAG: TVP38/TMEM64 family protein [Halobacteriaceae archaeon]